MSRARSLAAERPFLRLYRDEHTAAVVAAVQALDAKIAAEPKSPVASAVQAGETQHFIDPYREGRTSYVHRLVGGEEIIVVVPLKADCDDVANAVDVLVDTVLARLP